MDHPDYLSAAGEDHTNQASWSNPEAVGEHRADAELRRK
jgi:hypothetical protein